MLPSRINLIKFFKHGKAQERNPIGGREDLPPHVPFGRTTADAIRKHDAESRGTEQIEIHRRSYFRLNFSRRQN